MDFEDCLQTQLIPADHRHTSGTLQTLYLEMLHYWKGWRLGDSVL